MIHHSQKGVSLIISFFIMTIILAIVLGISTILFNEIKIISDISNSVSSFYAADTGIEKTLYFDRKQVTIGAVSGICNICNICNDSNIDPVTYCNNCTTTPLASGGCDVSTCNNCQINYDSAFAGRTYAVSATVSPNVQSPPLSDIIINSTGLYRGVTRKINLSNTR